MSSQHCHQQQQQQVLPGLQEQPARLAKFAPSARPVQLAQQQPLQWELELRQRRLQLTALQLLAKQTKVPQQM